MAKREIAAVLSLNLDKLKAAKGITSDPEVAKLTGISQKTINNISNERHDPQLSTVADIADGFGIEPYQLLFPAGETKFLEVCLAWGKITPTGKELVLAAVETALKLVDGTVEQGNIKSSPPTKRR